MFAVKVLAQQPEQSEGQINQKTHKPHKLYIDLFRREGEFGMKLKHPNIVEISRSLFAGPRRTTS